MADTGVYKKVPIAAIKIGDRFRKDYKDIESLANSIKNRMLYPIILNKNYELCEGGRRLEAAKFLKWEEIPALIREEDEEIDLRELELLGNMEREDFTWVERVMLQAKIHELHLAKDPTWSGRKTAARLNRSKSVIARQLIMAQRFEELPELKKHATESEAEKFLNNLEETMILKELADRNAVVHEETRALIKEAGAFIAAVDAERAEEAAKKIHPNGVPIIAAAPSKILPSFDIGASHGYIVADFFEAAATLPDEFLGYCSLIECDPDFGIDLNLILKNTKDPDAYHGVDRKEYPAYLERLTNELFRLLGDRSTVIFWFGIEWYKEVREALKEAGFNLNLNPGIWYKPGDNYGSAHNTNVYLCNVTEFFFVASKGGATLGKPRSPNIFPYKRPHSSARIHPTEKPLDLLEAIITTCYVIHPKSKCLVPFLGSGNVLKVCKKLGIEAFGFDLSENYRNKYLVSLEGEKDELKNTS